MTQDGRHDTAKGRRPTENRCGIHADEDIKSPKCRVTGNGKNLDDRVLRKCRIGLYDNIYDAGDETTGDEGGNDGDEDLRDF